MPWPVSPWRAKLRRDPARGCWAGCARLRESVFGLPYDRERRAPPGRAEPVRHPGRPHRSAGGLSLFGGLPAVGHRLGRRDSRRVPRSAKPHGARHQDGLVRARPPADRGPCGLSAPLQVRTRRSAPFLRLGRDAPRLLPGHACSMRRPSPRPRGVRHSSGKDHAPCLAFASAWPWPPPFCSARRRSQPPQFLRPRSWRCAGLRRTAATPSKTPATTPIDPEALSARSDPNSPGPATPRP